MSEYIQNQMDNLIQSGINERENMISELDKWKNIAKEQLQLLQMIENKINIDELSKLCNEYNRSNLKISNLQRDLEYKNNWSEESVAIQEIKQQISILQKIKETAQSKLQDIGIEF